MVLIGRGRAGGRPSTPRWCWVRLLLLLPSFLPSGVRSFRTVIVSSLLLLPSRRRRRRQPEGFFVCGGDRKERNNHISLVMMKTSNPDDVVVDDGMGYQSSVASVLAQLQYFLGGGGGGTETTSTAAASASTVVGKEPTTTTTTTTSHQHDGRRQQQQATGGEPAESGKGPAEEDAGTTTTTARSSIRALMAKLRQVSLVPLLVAFGIGYKVGITRAVQAMAGIVGSTTAIPSASTSTGSTVVRGTIRTYVLAAALIALLAREFWRNIPFWLKRQLPRLLLPKRLFPHVHRRRPQQSERHIGGAIYDTTVDPDDDGDEDNMASLPTIFRKLKSLLDLGSEKLGLNNQNKDKEDPTMATTTTSSSSSSLENIESSMLVLLRLIRQIKEYRPDIRDAEFLAYDRQERDGDDDAIVTPYHQQMFEYADAAYDELPNGQELRDFLLSSSCELIRHDAKVVPGSVAHYIAIDRRTKQAIIGVKGTSSLEDLLTDCCGVAVDYDGMRCHEGILTASKRLANDLETIVVDLLIPRGYSVTLTGHSLGAGVAALTGIILRKKHACDSNVVAYASPPILDYQSAAACRDFCTTIVNKADVIPRASLANLAVLKTLLVESIRPRMIAKGIFPADFQSIRALLSYLTKRVDDDSDETNWLMTAEEAKDAFRHALDQVPIQDPEHLYIPGQVLFLYQLWQKKDTVAVAVDDTDPTPVANNNGNNSSDNNEKKSKKTAHGVIRMQPTDHVLRHLEIDLSMVSDHLAPSYRESLRELVVMPDRPMIPPGAEEEVKLLPNA